MHMEKQNDNIYDGSDDDDGDDEGTKKDGRKREKKRLKEGKNVKNSSNTCDMPNYEDIICINYNFVHCAR